MTNDYRSHTNTVRAVGALDTQTGGRRREAATITRFWNGVQGVEHAAALQVRSPFGTPFQLPLRFDQVIDGRELLDNGAPGDLLRAEGTLEWIQRDDPRYAAAPSERGRRVTEVIFRPQRIAPAAPDDDLGCDVWLEGVVRRAARRYIHPDRRVEIAVVDLEMLVERTRRASLARLIEPVMVQVAIQLDHEHLPNLMRLGNRVALDGMLERVVVPLRRDDPAVNQAVQRLDMRWLEQQAAQSVGRVEEQRYMRRRRRLQETIVTRVVAGYVRLLEGAPATLAEAQEWRMQQRRRREADRRVRAERGPTETPELVDAGDVDQPPAPALEAGKEAE